MPLYDFECGNCNKIYECWLLKSDGSAKCPYCDAIEDQKKLILGAPRGIVHSDGTPKTDAELRNYAGDGKYFDSKGNIYKK